MQLESWENQEGEGILMKLDSGLIRIKVISSSIIKVTYSKTNENPLSLMILPQKDFSQFSIKEKGGYLELKTSYLKLLVDKKTSKFRWYDSKNNLITKNAGMELEKIPVMKTVVDKDAVISTQKTVDGEKEVVSGAKEVFDRNAYSAKLNFDFLDDEAIYGLGQHEEGFLNYRGKMQYLYQQNMKVAMPVVVSSKGYSILFDTYSNSIFRDDKDGSFFQSEVVSEFDYYFIYGPEFDQMIKGVRQLTGQSVMVPKWAYGYVQSKERYKTQEELIEIASEYRKRKIPLDCIVQDWCYWPEGTWSEKYFDKSRYPDMDVGIKQLHDMDIKLMISIWPHVRGGDNQKEMLKNDFMLSNGSTYNAYDIDARAMYWKHANDGLFQYGVDAWWCDCTEPQEGDWKGKSKLSRKRRMEINCEAQKKIIDSEFINSYSLEHCKGIYENQRKVTEEKRVVNLTRSGYPGQQRYGAITWSGDILANWRTLKRQIADGLNFCVTGNPKWTLDIGAFFSRKAGPEWFRDANYDEGCNDKGYRELYLRWFQYGAFLPMFRSHGTDTPREIWRFGKPGETIYDTLMKFNFLRYRLIPYIYSLAASETRDDYTTFRMLAFDFRDDSKVYNIKDQFMFGSAFMVCPVTKPMYYEKGSRKLANIKKIRKVYLPSENEWIDFWSGKRYSGGKSITVNAPLEIMPLFVKAGSIVPMGPKVQHTGEQLDAPWELRIYSGADGVFEVYEDEGDNYNYEHGKFATFKIYWKEDKKELTFSTRIGNFKGMVKKRFFKIIIVKENYGTGVELTYESNMEIEYKGLELKTNLKL